MSICEWGIHGKEMYMKNFWIGFEKTAFIRGVGGLATATSSALRKPSNTMANIRTAFGGTKQVAKTVAPKLK